MFFDNETNTVGIVGALRRYPDFLRTIIAKCQKFGISIFLITKTENIWCRDYMPIQVNDGFVKFNYKGYEKNNPYLNFPQLKVSPSCYDFLGNLHDSKIIIDGGNCQRIANKAFISEIIFTHNFRLRKVYLIKKLEKLLDAEIIMIPVEPNDDLGHADGILRPIDNRTVFINDYAVMKDDKWRRYSDKLRTKLLRAKVNSILFPYAYNKQLKMTEPEFRAKYPQADNFNPAIGYYINFLQVGQLILVPKFGFPEDSDAVALCKKYYPLCTVEQIPCEDIAMEGGLINCTTMNYKL